jgi:protein-S-isoprenylcysteine O-methyltransferase Ste14
VFARHRGRRREPASEAVEARKVAAAAWWKGTRGEWYVVVQIVLVFLIAVGPRTWNGFLQETGVYRVVRHPMYCGVILAAFGWAFLSHGWLTLGYVVAGCVFIEVKVRQEEKWLLERFPGYAAYQRRVRKLIPFVY